MTVADEPEPGRARPVPERFAVFESDPTAHLTEEQKQWKVVKRRPRSERFAVPTPQPPAEQAREIENGIAELVGALRRLPDLGAKPEAVAQALAGVLAGER